MANEHTVGPIFESLIKADAMEIDGTFIRNFSFYPDEIQTGNPDACVVLASAISQYMEEYEIDFSVAELETFSFHEEDQVWIGENDGRKCFIKFFSISPMAPQPPNPSTELSEIQKAAIRGYAGGDHAWLAEKGTITEEDINIFNDGVLPFLIKEMCPANHCENPEQAIERLQNVLEDICGAVNTLTMLQDKTEAAE